MTKEQASTITELDEIIERLIDENGIVPILSSTTKYVLRKAAEEEKNGCVGRQWRNVYKNLKSIWY